ncbi:MAG: cation diffusion facilitator family transporter [Acidimicrobiia bacterium]|nr:cation diffusion facilitator family transporter [Acidimicrobiia bacterium]
MSADEGHGFSVRAGARHQKRLLVVFGLVVVFMVGEIVAGVLTASLALISDAGHMATDALGLGMALAAITAANKATTGHRTFGLYRLEILAALTNAVLLFAVAGYVLYEAILRLNDPPDVLSGPMLIVALVGLGVNVFGWWILRAGADESMNVEGALLEVVADLIASLGVVAAAMIIQFTGWVYADPILGAGIGLFILPRAYRLGRKALRVLIQAAPENIDLVQLEKRLATIGGVTNVHDLHVWTLTSGMPVATVHLTAPADADRDAVIDQARRLLRDDFDVTHATLQVESGTEDCTELTW